MKLNVQSNRRLVGGIRSSEEPKNFAAMKNRNELNLTSPIQDFLQELHRQCAADNDGEVATYIPELAKADPGSFGICIVTANGAVYEVGDTQQEFTIQSISKPIVYGLALEDNGRAAT
jgi:glutaminase